MYLIFKKTYKIKTKYTLFYRKSLIGECSMQNEEDRLKNIVKSNEDLNSVQNRIEETVDKLTKRNEKSNKRVFILSAITLIAALIGGIPQMYTIVEFIFASPKLTINATNRLLGNFTIDQEKGSGIILLLTIGNTGNKKFSCQTGKQLEAYIDEEWITLETQGIPDNIWKILNNQNDKNISNFMLSLNRGGFIKDIHLDPLIIEPDESIRGHIYAFSPDIDIIDLGIAPKYRIHMTDISGKIWFIEFNFSNNS